MQEKSRSKPMTSPVGNASPVQSNTSTVLPSGVRKRLNGKHGIHNGNLLTAANITTIAVRQQQVVVTLLLNGFASHDAGRCSGQCWPVAPLWKRTVRYGRHADSPR